MPEYMFREEALILPYDLKNLCSLYQGEEFESEVVFEDEQADFGSNKGEKFDNQDWNELIRIILAFLVLAVCFLVMLAASKPAAEKPVKEVHTLCPKQSR